MVECKTDSNLTYSSDSSDFGLPCSLKCSAGQCAHRKRHVHTHTLIRAEMHIMFPGQTSLCPVSQRAPWLWPTQGATSFQSIRCKGSIKGTHPGLHPGP